MSEKRSKNNKLCFSKCFKKYTPVLHPYLFRPISRKEDFCLTYPYLDKNQKYFNYTDECNDPEDFEKDDLNKLIVPSLLVNEKILLNDIYNINSLNDGLKWIKTNENLPYNTVNRILNCIWIVFNNEIKINLDEMKKFYIYFSKKYFIKNSKINDDKLLKKINKSFEKLLSRKKETLLFNNELKNLITNK